MPRKNIINSDNDDNVENQIDYDDPSGKQKTVYGFHFVPPHTRAQIILMMQTLTFFVVVSTLITTTIIPNVAQDSIENTIQRSAKETNFKIDELQLATRDLLDGDSKSFINDLNRRYTRFNQTPSLVSMVSLGTIKWRPEMFYKQFHMVYYEGMLLIATFDGVGRASDNSLWIRIPFHVAKRIFHEFNTCVPFVDRTHGSIELIPIDLYDCDLYLVYCFVIDWNTRVESTPDSHTILEKLAHTGLKGEDFAYVEKQLRRNLIPEVFEPRTNDR